MAGFGSYEEFDLAIRNGQADDYQFSMAPNITTNIGFLTSTWYDGSASKAPGNGAAPSNGGTQYVGPNAGAMTFNNVAPMQRYLRSIEFAAPFGSVGMFMLYDRLCAVGGLSPTTTGVQSITMPALPRYTSGVGVQAWLEQQTGTGVTYQVNISYTNQAGTAGQTSMANGPNNRSGPFIFPLGLQDGSSDTGIKAVASINVVSTSSPAAVFSIVLVKPLAYLTMPQVPTQTTPNLTIVQDYIMDLTALPRIFDGANLSGAFISPQTNTACTFNGLVRTVYN